MIALIYKLTNAINGKVYIGQTWQTLEERWHNGFGYHGCKHLDAAIKKYGKENFAYTVLTVASTQEVVDYWEQYFIERYNSTNQKIGYNMTNGGFGVGRTFSANHKRAISKALKGRKLSNEHLANRTKAQTGTSSSLRGKTWKLINGKRVWSNNV